MNYFMIEVEMEKLKAELWDKVQYIFRNYYDRMIHSAVVYDGEIDLDILRKSIYRVVDYGRRR